MFVIEKPCSPNPAIRSQAPGLQPDDIQKEMISPLQENPSHGPEPDRRLGDDLLPPPVDLDDRNGRLSPVRDCDRQVSGLQYEESLFVELGGDGEPVLVQIVLDRDLYAVVRTRPRDQPLAFNPQGFPGILRCRAALFQVLGNDPQPVRSQTGHADLWGGGGDEM